MAYKFSDSIQRGILYLLKSDKDFYLQIINLIKPEYFEFDAYRHIFQAVTDHYNEYKVLPPDTIILNSIKDKFKPDSIGEYEDEIEYINTLDISAIENKNYFLDIIENFAKKSALGLAIAKGVSLLKAERFDEIELEIKKALMINRDINLGQNYFFDVNDRWDRLNSLESRLTFKTPFNKINEILGGGAYRKELCFVAARSGGGKSLFLANQAVISLQENRNVLYLSAEMSEDRISQRIDSIITLIPQEELKSKKDILNKRLDIFKSQFPGGKLIVKEFPACTATVNTIRALVNQLQNYEDFIPDVVIVDYLELLRPTTEGMTEYHAQERIAQELRGFAMEHNCLVWTATQVNREGAKSQIITDVVLGDSYAKIKPCDFAISLNQTDEEYDQGRLRIYGMKSRNSKRGYMFPIKISYSTLRMENLVEEDED